MIIILRVRRIFFNLEKVFFFNFYLVFGFLHRAEKRCVQMPSGVGVFRLVEPPRWNKILYNYHELGSRDEGPMYILDSLTESRGGVLKCRVYHLNFADYTCRPCGKVEGTRSYRGGRGASRQKVEEVITESNIRSFQTTARWQKSEICFRRQDCQRQTRPFALVPSLPPLPPAPSRLSCMYHAVATRSPLSP